jgi:hypothetical protein
MTDRHARGARGLGLVAAALSLLRAPPATPAAGAEAEVRHLSQRTVAEAGRTRVIAFEVASPPAQDLVLPATCDDEAVLRIVRPARVTAGSSIGYLRVEGRATGATRITVGGAPLAVSVEARQDPLELDDARPRLIGPARGAAIWGRIAVGVELRQDRGAPSRVEVRLGDGAALQPREQAGDTCPPWRQFVCELDAGDHPAGALTLTPVAIDAAGAELQGEPVLVRVIHPGPESITAGEAETRYQVRRPQRFADERMHVGRDRRASGGAYFNNAGALPAVCFPMPVEESGWYQVMLIAGGTRGGGALPTVGIVVDEGEASTTNVRLLEEGFHRLAAGVPIHLEAGARVLTPFFANDFYVPGLADRNLRLDRIEVARLSEADAPGRGGADGGAGMMGMAADTEMAASMNAGARAGGAMAATLDAGMSAGMSADAEANTPARGGGAGLDDHGLTARGLRLGLVRPLQGRTLGGLVEVEGRAWWPRAEETAPPLVRLLVNGRTVATQRSAAPRFWIDPSNFVTGENTIALVGVLDDGAEARTPVQTLDWPAGPGDDPPPPRRHWRFGIHDRGWGDSVPERLRPDHHPGEIRAALLSSNGAIALALPDEIAGRYDVYLELHGEHFEGPPIATLTLETAGQARSLGSVAAPTWWDLRRVAEDVELPAGPKRLLVGYENDRFVAERGDRNLRIQALCLVQGPLAPDRTAPTVEVAWPPDRLTTWMADVVVAEASDNASLHSAELIFDGRPTGVAVPLNLKPGRAVLPLLLRGVAPGVHTVAVAVRDVSENSIVSEPRTIIVAEGPPAGGARVARAVRLLNRFAFGPDPDELAAILELGERGWLAERLARSFDEPGDLAALGGAIPPFPRPNEYEIPRRAIAHLLLTPNPARARFVLWAQNHFSTWIRKTQGNRKWAEHVTFARLGPDRFHRLLERSAQSPAMLAYLDQQGSFAGRMNENYARELLELHTLGVDGGYTQADVTSLARLLTGWTATLEGDGRGGGEAAQRYTFRFDPALSEGAGLRVLGLDFEPAEPQERYDRARLALEMLSAHPQTARFVATSLAEHYVCVPPPAPLVAHLERLFHEEGGDLRAMVRAIPEHPSFWDEAATERVASGLDYALRLCRTSGHFQPWMVGDFLQRSGQQLFDRASPDGYPEADSAHTDSNALVQRWRMARQMQWPLAGLVPGSWRFGPAAEQDDWAQRVIDVIALRLTGGVLAPTSNAAALEFAASLSGSSDERVRVLGPFVAQLPEAHLR